ncbi:MAG: two-component system, OmpR family, response regulator [Actinomycetota bacterium]|nr:two-component system, OmpR family, response regulator [Actinomycetota bacterium]
MQPWAECRLRAKARALAAVQTDRVKVLLVDDEVRLAAALGRGLGAHGFAVDVVHEGPAALEACLSGRYDTVVLDIMLPGMSGYEVLRRLRARDDHTPVLMLSAKDGEHDLGDALDLGADDYLVKPFSYVVLVARLKALQRRGRTQATTTVTVGLLQLDTARRTVTHDGEPVKLSRREFQLLHQLMRADGAVVSKLELLERVFALDPDSHPNVVEVYVGYLRRKLGRDQIVTVRGEGYRLSIQ